MLGRVLFLIAVIVLWGLSPIRSQAQESWGVIAVCYIPDKSGYKEVGISYRTGPLEELAKAASLSAVYQSMNSNRALKCDFARVFNKGCAYVVSGCNERTKWCGWAMAETEADVLKQLRSQGY